jgi:hypothetical protein
LPSGGCFLDRDPAGMLPGYQRFDAFGKQRWRAGCGGVVAGAGVVQVLFATHPLSGRPVGDPVLLELVELLDAFQNHDQAAEAAGDPG